MPNIIKGHWFANGSSKDLPAQLVVENEQFSLQVKASNNPSDNAYLNHQATVQNTQLSGAISELEISDRVGNIPRKITFGDGSVFSTYNNDLVDQTLGNPNSIKHLIHTVEGSLKWVLVAIVVTVLTSFSFLRWGVPWLSYEIAHALPEQTNELISEGTIALFDKHVFRPSKVSIHKQEQIRAHFNKVIVPLETNTKLNYKLHFRDWTMRNQAIPNALALPSGDIILTDKFVELSHTQAEMDSVLLHEMGHVVHRHGLQKVVQGTTLTVVFLVVFGDANGVVDLVVGTSGALLSSAYSRDHENEADEYSFRKMLNAGIDPKNFSTIMQRMENYMNGSAGQSKPKESASKDENAKDEEGVLGYFASHPQTKTRVELAEKFSQCFRQGDRVCANAESE